MFFFSYVPEPMIKVTELAEGIKVTCPAEYKFAHNNTATEEKLKTKDESTGEYICTKNTGESIKIFVMFRSKFCINNCVVKCDEKNFSFQILCCIVCILFCTCFTWLHSVNTYIYCMCVFAGCDNCVELDIMSTVGMVIGNVVATIVIGVGVYLLASQTRTGPVVSNRKSKSKDCLSVFYCGKHWMWKTL